MNEEQSFAELLAQLMNNERLKDKGLAKKIRRVDDDGSYTGTTITYKKVERWREGNNTPSKREYILQMIMPLRLAQKAGLEKCNALLPAAGFFVLDTQ